MSEGGDSIRAELIVEKAEYVADCLSMLAEKRSIEFDDYVRNAETRDVVERRFEKMTQACIDIARILLRDVDGTAAETNAAAMRRLHDIGALTETTAEEMAEAASFRNVLAHEYGDVIDHEVVYDALQDLTRYERFLREIREYLRHAGAI